MSDWASPTAQSVRHLVYQTFAQQGRAASPAELAGELELDPAHVLDALRELHDRHALVLTPAGDAIRMAHPFSAAPMGFVVRADDQFWWGGCAWDSFGITAALDRQMEITTCCAGCGRELVYVAGPATPPTLDAVVLIPRPAREWWDDVVATCSSIRVYCRRTEMPTHCQRPSCGPRWWPTKSPHSSWLISWFSRRPPPRGSGLFHPVAVAVGDDDVAVVQEPVEHADGGGVFGQEPAPGFEGPVRADAERASFVGSGDEPEQQLRAGVIQRREAQFVDQHEVVAQQVLDHSSDAVVGQRPVEGFDELGGGEVPNSVSCFDGGDAERDQDVGLAGAGRADQTGVLRGRGSTQGWRGSRTSLSGSRTRRRRTPPAFSQPGTRRSASGFGRWTRRGR